MSATAADPWSDFQAAEIPQIVLRHSKLAAAFFCLALLLAIVASILLPRTYRSQGKLLVRSGRENAASDPVAILGADNAASAAQVREYDVNSVAELLTNRELVEKIIDAIGVTSFTDVETPQSPRDPGEKTWWDAHNPLAALSPREVAVRNVSKRLKVEPAVKSNVVVITYEDRSPELAQAVVAKLMAAYLEVHLRLNRTRGSFDFLERQSSDLRGKLEGFEAALAAAKSAGGMLSTAEQAQKIGEQIRLVEAGLLTARAEAAACQARTERLRKWSTELAATEVTGQTSGLEDKAVVGMREQLFGLLLREQELLASTKPEYFEVPQIRQRIAQAKAVLNEQPPTRTETVQGPSKRVEEAQVQLLRWEPEGVGWEAKVQAWIGQLSALQKAVCAYHQSELRITQLQRDVELCDKDYRKCQASFEQARLDQALEASRIASINIAQPATWEEKPVWPRPLLNLGLGAFVGIFGGMCLALAAEFRTRTRSTTGGTQARGASAVVCDRDCHQ